MVILRLVVTPNYGGSRDSCHSSQRFAKSDTNEAVGRRGGVTTMQIHQASSLPRPIAFVLSGGASLGAVQVGMLSVLHEMGVQPDLLVGTSVGALNAAFIGSGFTGDRIEALARLWGSLTTARVFTGVGLRSTVRALSGSGAFASFKGLDSLLRAHTPERHEDLAIPTAVCATDLRDGTSIVLRSGDLRSNVKASAAIPMVFPSVVVAGRTLVDGGISANVPLAAARALGARTFVVLDAGYPCALPEVPRNPVGQVIHLMLLMLRHQSQSLVETLGTEHMVLYLPSPCPVRVSPHDFSHGAALIDAGRDTARHFFASASLSGPGVHGHPHVHDRVLDA